jgi:large subunit ribosomal protein L1
MGKIRVNTIGDETAEKKQQEEAEKRRAAKRATKASEAHPETAAGTEGTPQTQSESKKQKNMVKKSSGKTKVRSPRYVTSRKLSDKNKLYPISEALDMLSSMQKAKFDETIELHINTNDKVNGNVVLPNGTGKQTRIAILAPASDPAGAEKLLKDIEAGKISFDILVATPDAMPKLAKVARVLGPKGLMPNPKNGTITPRPEEVAKKYEGGQMNFKTEAKANIVHVTVGKISFGKEKLTANIQTLLAAMDSSKIKNVYIKSTMSPSLKVNLSK